MFGRIGEVITYFQAIIIGLLQGVTELFPISSLGHSVLIANLFGWNSILTAQTAKTSFYLTFLVALHVATAIALFIFYRKVWYKIFRGFIDSIKFRRISTIYERLAWLLIVATIPAALIAFLLENKLRSQFALPLSAAIFLVVNGFILLIGDYRQRQTLKQRSETLQTSNQTTASKLTLGRAGIMGVAQSFALIAGISRSGITMTTGLFSGLSTESAARFSFLLATPIIFLAGMYKLPELAKPAAHAILPQTIVGAVVAGIAAYISVRFLDKYFQNKHMWPFAVYCFAFGGLMIILQFIR
jgi:undecaprenyl-diphosphatase